MKGLENKTNILVEAAGIEPACSYPNFLLYNIIL